MVARKAKMDGGGELKMERGCGVVEGGRCARE